jgi:hypothetical protein
VVGTLVTSVASSTLVMQLEWGDDID